jgi:Secretion system C-terminal sorting domain
MKIVKLLFLLGIPFGYFAQSNTPCSSPPTLIPSPICLSTTGTTIGATYQSNAANGGTPSCASPGAPDVWYQFMAPLTGSVTITTSAGTITDGGMALYSGTCPNSFTQLQCDDDSGPGLMPQISASNLTPGQTYYVRFWRFGGSGTGTFSICVVINPPPAPNTTCAQPSPICSGTPINFTANTGSTPASSINPGNNYGCLVTTPNPSWYYLRIATPGNLVIDITAGSDVDYAIWGPFPNLANAQANCNSYGMPIDCSYSTSATEQAVVNGVTTGQVYILLVTNYANTIQNISVNQSLTNTATTDCSIIPLPVGYGSYGVYYNGEHVSVNWTTETEKNSDYFAVQRSANGTIWETISLVTAAGNSTSTRYYEAIDTKPIDGIGYYRLMQVDRDGLVDFTDIKSVNTQAKSVVELYPNPSDDQFFVAKIGKQVPRIFITDVVGKTLELPATEISNGLLVNTKAIEAGIYTLTISDEKGNEQTTRLVVQHGK